MAIKLEKKISLLNSVVLLMKTNAIFIIFY